MKKKDKGTLIVDELGNLKQIDRLDLSIQGIADKENWIIKKKLTEQEFLIATAKLIYELFKKNI